MSDSFIVKCESCKQDMYMTKLKDEKGNYIPHPDKPGKFRWAPFDKDGKKHGCRSTSSEGSMDTIKGNCMYCKQKVCKCKHTKCTQCHEGMGWFRDCTDELEKHIKEGYHFISPWHNVHNVDLS